MAAVARGSRWSDETTSATVCWYDNSLILLYRLLFILYAEARNLLPLQENRAYTRKYSLHAIKQDAVSDLKEGLILTNSSTYWSRLKDLFRAINLGNSPLRITPFNGGLFDPKEHDFLERYTVADLDLCKAIDKLARVNSQFVDYRDLAERHLGTIYEGLLEYTLRVATEPMVELRSSSKIVPAKGVPKKDIVNTFDIGEVYLVTDRGERKRNVSSTGNSSFPISSLIDKGNHWVTMQASMSSSATLPTYVRSN